MRRESAVQFLLVGVLCSIPVIAIGAPISVAGIEFPNGEDDFAKDAVVVSGTVTGSSLSEVQATLVGSGITDSIRVITPDVAEIEITFGARQILNESGPDVVVFELSGDQLPGTPDFNERFEVSILGGGFFTPFQVVVPVATGFDDPADSSLDVFAVLLDLSDYGLAPGEVADRVRIRLVDNLVTRSADPTAVGLLHSVPEPGPVSDALVALLLGATIRSHMRKRSSKSCAGLGA